MDYNYLCMDQSRGVVTDNSGSLFGRDKTFPLVMTHFPPTIATLTLTVLQNEICVTVVREISQRHEIQRNTFYTITLF